MTPLVTISRVVFGLLLLYAGNGVITSAPDLARGATGWTILHAVAHLLIGVSLLLYGVVQFGAGLWAELRPLFDRKKGK